MDIKVSTRIEPTKFKDGYPPDQLLVNYMHQKVQFERNREKIKLQGKELKKDSTYSKLKKRKYDVLDRVFRSMANLIFFFRCIAEYPELENVFEDDILDLFGIKRDDHQKEAGFVFYDLLDYIIIGRKGGRYSAERDDRIDFRLILNHLAQKIVSYKIAQSQVSILDMDEPRAVIKSHFEDVWAWTGMLSTIANRNMDDGLPPNRTLDLGDRNLPN